MADSELTPTLDEYQMEAFLSMRAYGNSVVIGFAGCGKTFTTKYTCNWLLENVYGGDRDAMSDDVKLWGTTGASAINVNGGTFNSGIGIKYTPTDRKKFVDAMLRSRKRHILAKVGKIFIDEAFMLSELSMESFDDGMCMIRGTPLWGKPGYVPFGGVSIILIGDPRQLGPISKKPPDTCATSRFLFQSNRFPTWFPMDSHFILKTNHRQKEEMAFQRALDNIGMGEADAEDILFIKSLCVPFPVGMQDWRVFAYNFIKNHFKGATLICGKNVDKDTINNLFLKDIANANKGKEVVHEFKADDVGDGDYLEKNARMPTSLIMMKDVQVILRKNISGGDGRIVVGNGSKGIVTEVVVPKKRKILEVSTNGEDNYLQEQPYVMVKFPELPEPIPIGVDNEEFKDEHDVVFAYRRQLPLNLGWAQTIHSVQGLTIKGRLVFYPTCFATGQFYVGFSRVVKKDNIKILGQFDISNVKTNSNVVRYMKNITRQIAKRHKNKQTNF